MLLWSLGPYFVLSIFMFYSERKLDSTPFFIQKRRLERNNTQYANLPASLRSGPHLSTLPVQLEQYSPPAKCPTVNVAPIRGAVLLAVWLVSPPPPAQGHMLSQNSKAKAFVCKNLPEEGVSLCTAWCGCTSDTAAQTSWSLCPLAFVGYFCHI